MNGISPVLLMLMALIGHGGIHIALYNRINGFGWRRVIVKGWVKLFMLTTVLIPLLITLFEGSVLLAVANGEAELDALSSATRAYAGFCLMSWLFLGIPFIVFRPIFGLEAIDAPRQVEVVDATQKFDHELALTPRARFEAAIPFNQLLELSLDHVELPVHGLPPELDGYRIAQLSDIHLTGEIHSDYYRLAIDLMMDWRPQIVALTGDIIDVEPCLDWIGDLFAPVHAEDGCYFLLGNHDKRIAHPDKVRLAMEQAGWTDLGGAVVPRDLAGVSCELIGNEHPWFPRPRLGPAQEKCRILFSHSPDQLTWARKHGVKLMLAGHTHGGQGRLPILGPLLSPSLHGSRYSSGDFYREPTTMHVTRGLSGVHLMRINCRPEVSLLTLRVKS